MTRSARSWLAAGVAIFAAGLFLASLANLIQTVTT